MFEQHWDETATNPFVDCSMEKQACVRVMAIHAVKMCAVYGVARFTPRLNNRHQFLFARCDRLYKVEQPLQLIPIYNFVKLAGYAENAQQFSNVFLTQGLLLPSGSKLYPGASLRQVGNGNIRQHANGMKRYIDTSHRWHVLTDTVCDSSRAYCQGGCQQEVPFDT